MTRQINFRAWDKKTNTMWEKAGMDAHSNYCYADPAFGNKGSIMKQFDDLHIEKYNIYYPADIELMQFTGLLDKNGKEIYEGDILKSDRDSILTINWCHERYGWLLFFKDKNEGTIFFDNVDGIEIIGNIHENSELIK